MILKGGKNICGVPIGVLSLESYFPKPPGHIKHPASFDFPIFYKIVKGARVKELLEDPGPQLLEPFIEAVKDLEAEGVRAITGSCGFLALFQRELADAVSVPVFISSLLQVPMVGAMLRRDQIVGVMTASRRNLTPAHLEALGADRTPLAIAGMDDCPEFNEVIIEEKRRDFDLDRLQAEIYEVADALVEAHPEVGAIVLECTDLPPFGFEIQARTGRPVFDLTNLTNFVFQAVVRQPYRGLPL
jgi:hypothetical protein